MLVFRKILRTYLMDDHFSKRQMANFISSVFYLSMTGFLSNQWFLLCIVFISIYQSLKMASKVFLDAYFIKKIQRIKQGMQALMERKKPVRKKNTHTTLNGFSTMVLK